MSGRQLEMETHLAEPAIVLRLLETGGEKQQRKIVELAGLGADADSGALARLVADQCQGWIPGQRLPELAQLIAFLQRRHATDGEGRPAESPGTDETSLEDVEECLELLYEEGAPKQRGVSRLSALVLSLPAAELPKIAENEQLMGALARLWKEDGRRNLEQATQLGHLFHRLSQFGPLHPVLAHWKIGLLSLQLAEHELHRWSLWRNQLQTLEDQQARRKWEFAMRKQDQLILVCLRILHNLAEDLRTEGKMVHKGLVPLLFMALEHTGSPQLLLAAVRLLWKLSQFAENQHYIAEAEGTVEQLVSLFPSSAGATGPSHQHSTGPLLRPLCALLFNCSFESASRLRMVQAGLVPLLAPHIAEGTAALALMYQLSILEDAKAMVAFTDCIPTLLDLLFHGGANGEWLPEGGPDQAGDGLLLSKSLLANIALERRNAELICGTDGQGMDRLMAVALDGEEGDLLTLKVARNVAMHEGPTREMMVKWVPQLLENALSQEEQKQQGQCSPSAHTFGVECLGICAQIPSAPWPELDDRYGVVPFLARVLGKRGEHAHGTAQNSSSSRGRRRTKEGQGPAAGRGTAPEVADDLLLQVVLLCGTLACHSLAMAERVEDNLLAPLVTAMNNCRADDELVLQCAFAFHCLLSYGGQMAKRICAVPNYDAADSPPTSGVVELLLDLMHHKNPRLRTLCDKALLLAANSSEHWRRRIQEARFRWHNAQWLDMVRMTGQPAGGGNGPNTTTDGEGELAAQLGQGIVLNSDELLAGTQF